MRAGAVGAAAGTPAAGAIGVDLGAGIAPGVGGAGCDDVVGTGGAGCEVAGVGGAGAAAGGAGLDSVVPSAGESAMLDLIVLGKGGFGRARGVLPEAEGVGAGGAEAVLVVPGAGGEGGSRADGIGIEPGTGIDLTDGLTGADGFIEP